MKNHVNLPSLKLVVLRVSELDKSARFYRALGFHLKLEKHGSGPEHYSCNAGAVMLELYPVTKAVSEPGAVMLGFEVASIIETLRSVTEQGGSVISGPTETKWGLRAVVLDPDGYKLEMIESNKLL
jgi:predicted enzyme related to lactoylglutathione lyase